MRLYDFQSLLLELAKNKGAFCRLADTFSGTTFSPICQTGIWRNSFWTTNEFKRVIQTREESLDPLLRPPRWIVVYRH